MTLTVRADQVDASSLQVSWDHGDLLSGPTRYWQLFWAIKGDKTRAWKTCTLPPTQEGVLLEHLPADGVIRIKVRAIDFANQAGPASAPLDVALGAVQFRIKLHRDECSQFQTKPRNLVTTLYGDK